ncbi:hypothetical protein OG357_14475 [Streptomyces sp. NBC_01255]|uniref:hypothetical protein n=1 Tax=Streptomyces sp. NBC_01255 TaxID=2903798 RepID=UPI002E3666DF|nr:hypothetical protein [Streptomyces sp. NBC_01255]
MRTALRTAVAVALVAGVAITTPALTAGAALAADGPVTAKQAAQSAGKPAGTSDAKSDAQSAGKSAGESDAKPAAKPAAKSAATPAPTATVAAPPVSAPATTAPATSAPAAVPSAGSAKGTLVRTQTLITGTVVKIYKVNALHYRAELFRQGHPVGVLDANTRSAAGQDNGEFLVLNPDGTIHNWIGNIAPGVPGIYRLDDGTVVELGKKNGVFGLQLIDTATDKGSGYIYVHAGTKVYFFGKAVVVLHEGGSFSAYVPGSSKQAAPQPYGMGSNGQGEPAPVDKDTLGACTIASTVSIGAGAKAKLIMSPQGPKAKLTTADANGADKVFATLDRKHPALPKSAGIVARIVAANSTAPSLYTKVEGGTAKGATHAFPKLPKGCKLAPVKGAVTNGTGRAGGTGATVHAGQTSVIPRGGVAAGAEFGTEAAGSQGGSTVLIAVGAGAASATAVGLGFVALRRRAAARV